MLKNMRLQSLLHDGIDNKNENMINVQWNFQRKNGTADAGHAFICDSGYDGLTK